MIVVAGGKEDGIASLRKRVGELVAIDGHLPKYHGIAFWFRRPAGEAIATVLRAANPSLMVEDRYETAPGMFSYDRVDAGSRFLAEHLPIDIKGRVADFCAGWGFLSAALAERCSNLAGIDLYEADYPSVQAAGRTLARLAPGSRAGIGRRHHPRGSEGAETGRSAFHGGEPAAALRACSGRCLFQPCGSRPQRRFQGSSGPALTGGRSAPAAHHPDR